MIGEWCADCRDFHGPGRHMPEYRVWREKEKAEDGVGVRARNAEHAAERWADEYDSGGDYSIVGGSPETVWVRGPEGAEARYRVSGESVPHYSAELVT